MAIDPSQIVLQFCIQLAIVLAVGAGIYAMSRKKPRGTYGNGLPERRKRPRISLPDPATLQPRPVAPGQTI